MLLALRRVWLEWEIHSEVEALGGQKLYGSCDSCERVC